MKNVRRDLSKKLLSILPKGINALIKEVGRLADSKSCGAFIVGGLVRDLLLGVKNLDLDIVVEGDAIELAKALAKSTGGPLVIHKRFGTASVITRGKFKIDFATARRERYERPAALPTVEFSSLKDDLARRDFTINAMAVSINGASFGQLIDFFGGEPDLAAGRIKVMHDESFIDDPTRIFRAVRFEERLGFKIDRHTEELMKRSVACGMIDRLGSYRIRKEVALILKEPKPLKTLKRMEEFAGVNSLRK